MPQCSGPVSPQAEIDLGCGSWALEAPLPQAHELAAVWALSNDNAWAVGQAGAIVHWDGATWSVASSPTTANLSSVWGTDANHVWAAGSGGVFVTFDGGGWHVTTSPTTANITFIRGAAADDIWARGDAQNIFHWDGERWTQPGDATGSPYSDRNDWRGYPIWPTGGGRAWSGGCADGANASLYFWDGASWSRTDTRVPGCIDSIAGTSADDVWATSAVSCGKACTSHRALHWDGLGWSEASTGLPIYGQFFSPAPSEVWFPASYRTDRATVLARREAGAFRAFFSLPYTNRPWYVTGLGAASPTDIFMVGSGGLLAHSDGKTTTVFTGPNSWLNTLWSDGKGDAWAVGQDGALVHSEQGCWSTVDPGDAANDPISGDGPMPFWAASGSSADDVWMTSSTFAVHWDGHSLSRWATPGGIFFDVWASPAGHAFFATTMGVYRFEGTGFTPVADGSVHKIWGASDTDLWWIREEGLGSALVHFDGAAAATVALLPWYAHARMRISAIGGDDVWAEVDATLMHFDGVSSKTVTPSSAWVNSVAVAGRDDVWAASDDGLWHFDGTSWSAADAPAGMLSATGGTIYTLGLGRICRKP